MEAYINGIGLISPQQTFNVDGFPSEIKSAEGERMNCIEPDYNGWIDARLIRRMSKVIRMGVASSLLALKEAGIEKPDAIITGTAFGCLEDTGIFLNKLISNNEQALNPTPFIQSTHNTIGSQVALILQCLGYNQTYSQRAFSFENALLDALMISQEQNVLLGGIDELTDYSFDIQKRFPLKKEITLGEGAAFFLLSNEKTKSTYAKVKSVATFYKSQNSLTNKVNEFLSRENLSSENIDLILIGKNGDENSDESYNQFVSKTFPLVTTAAYKNLCGEYPTANSFALAMASKILKTQTVPEFLNPSKSTKNIQRVLIYNQYFGEYHSFILVEYVG